MLPRFTDYSDGNLPYPIRRHLTTVAQGNLQQFGIVVLCGWITKKNYLNGLNWRIFVLCCITGSMRIVSLYPTGKMCWFAVLWSLPESSAFN